MWQGTGHRLCSTVAIQALEQNCVIIDVEAHPTCVFVDCHSTCVFAFESVCYTADGQSGDARTGLHRVSNATAGGFALCMLCSAALVFDECAFLPVMAAFSYLVGICGAELRTVISVRMEQAAGSHIKLMVHQLDVRRVLADSYLYCRWQSFQL